ncbi:peptide/nickel transport system substrate-binding protein [Anaerocolumna jejuensis DSM 15929]|uniref:Peptide/nickel transport system substrate-binding protein n=1 Tax=Anaerocolumna jejuensis DSM 15929 TaxID=1121322 RepID=A0A1M6U0R0_9FIRM|nr:ABC transporter substrate-binding protein [Anaerocolumna jejuensis]SHK62714.1 peptide/nickel transport system substrate-binding protein [Anaerocolumna jejuensis DSM 15929]
MKKNVKRFLSLLLTMVMVLSMLTACKSNKTDETSTKDTPTPTATTEATDTPTATPATEEVKPGGELPRNETLYYGGLQWGAVNGWNPLSDDMNNALAITQSGGGSRTPMFETLYMYNMLDDTMTPLLADGDYQWNADRTEITVKIKSAAKWSDGTAVTADDVAYTFEADAKVKNGQGVALAPYIESVTAVDPQTVLIKAKLDAKGKAVNPLLVVAYLGQTYVIQKAWIQKVEARCNNDAAAIKKDAGEDVVYSGPYHNFYNDDQKVVLVRNDSYWGQDASMWGKLPAPKYLCHTIYADNPATEVAFKAGEVDVDQQFIPNIQDLWEKDGLPISTYLQDAPYGICVNMPTAWFNMDNKLLQNVAIRKAIAMAVDYDAINANAMTGQSPTFKNIPRSVMNPTDGEQAKYDHDAVKDLQWTGNDIEGAKKLLDDAGIKDKNGDGIRELDGKKLSFVAACPDGWTDWQAAIEIVAAAGKNIGIDITTQYPQADVFQSTVTSKKQTEYDIFMMWTDSAGPTQPWGRLRMLTSSEYNGVDNNWAGNWGHYSNKRMDELIKLIPGEADPAKQKEYYTEAVKIYLTDVPSFSLMYRPDQFHAVNESIWTNYPESGDGNNIPPLVLLNGYSIAGLYKIDLVK